MDILPTPPPTLVMPATKDALSVRVLRVNNVRLAELPSEELSTTSKSATTTAAQPARLASSYRGLCPIPALLVILAAAPVRVYQQLAWWVSAIPTISTTLPTAAAFSPVPTTSTPTPPPSIVPNATPAVNCVLPQGPHLALPARLPLEGCLSTRLSTSIHAALPVLPGSIPTICFWPVSLVQLRA